MNLPTAVPSNHGTSIPCALTVTTLCNSPKPKIWAVVEVATTAIRMRIFSVDPRSSTFKIRHRAEQPIRWSDPATQQLSEAAMQRGIDCLRQYCEIARCWGAEKIGAIATSAVRDASNRDEFLQKVEQTVGLIIRVLPGEQETYLTYLGVLSEMPSKANQRHIIIDIGGGSTELILGTGTTPQVLQSLPVGAVRQTRAWVKTDPISPLEFIALQADVYKQLEPAVNTIQDCLGADQPARLIGTSSGIITLAAIHARDRFGKVPASLEGYSLSLKDVEDLVDRFRCQSTRERSTLPELSNGLADIIVAGAVILQEAMALLRVDHITVSEGTLMEGVVDWWMLTRNDIDPKSSESSCDRVQCNCR